MVKRISAAAQVRRPTTRRNGAPEGVFLKPGT